MCTLRCRSTCIFRDRISALFWVKKNRRHSRGCGRHLWRHGADGRGSPDKARGFISEQPLLIGLARPAPCANFSRRSGRNPSEVCCEPQNRQRHFMASPIPKHAKYQPGCGPGNMILKHFLLFSFIKNPIIIRHIRTPPGNEPWATEPPRKTSSPTARMLHMK